jgi:hypothetical protein
MEEFPVIQVSPKGAHSYPTDPLCVIVMPYNSAHEGRKDPSGTIYATQNDVEDRITILGLGNPTATDPTLEIRLLPPDATLRGERAIELVNKSGKNRYIVFDELKALG